MNTSALIRPAWTPATIALMVIGFVVFWPLGLAMLAYIIWGDRLEGFKRDVNRATDGMFRGLPRAPPIGPSAAPAMSAFDDWREKELERLAEERRKLDEMLERVRRICPRAAPRQGPGRVRPVHGEPLALGADGHSQRQGPRRCRRPARRGLTGRARPARRRNRNEKRRRDFPRRRFFCGRRSCVRHGFGRALFRRDFRPRIDDAHAHAARPVPPQAADPPAACGGALSTSCRDGRCRCASSRTPGRAG